MSDSIPPEARVGELVDNRFRLVRHLATGGMAAVYRAEHVNNRQVFAVKVLNPDYSKHPEASARFQREVQAYRRIRHPHIVAAIDFGRLDDGCLFMVLEFIQGEDLCSLLARTGPLPPARAGKIAYQVSLALVAAHATGVIHRDLKPENIMLIARDGQTDFVKLVDFGIAKIPTKGQALTALGSVFGTPEYMAPEQARGGQVDARTDLYALGIVLYEMLAGRPPFTGPSPGDLIIAQLKTAPPPLPASIDHELAALVMQLLAKDPGARVQSAAELSERLQRIVTRLAPGLLGVTRPVSMTGASISSRPPPPLQSPASPALPLPPAIPRTPPPPALQAPTIPFPLQRPAPNPSPAPPPTQASPMPTSPVAQPAKKSANWIAATVLIGVVAALGWLVTQLF